MLILQDDDIRGKEELINAIHDKHKNCKLHNKNLFEKEKI